MARLRTLSQRRSALSAASSGAAALLTFTALAASTPAAQADSLRHDEAKFASGAGNLVYLALGTFLPLATDGSDGERHTLRNGDALVSAALLTEGLKAITREERPDHSSRDSFPSGHASAAFAVAAMQAHWHPRQAVAWYAGAAVIAESRVTLKRHYWHDVLAGAALGIGMAAVEWHQPRGLLIAPIYPARRGKAAGVSLGFSRSF